MIFLTAGHNLNDSGAVYNGRKEADETIKLRNAIAKKLDEKSIGVWKDKDEWDLNKTVLEINKISEPNDIICDLHFNAGGLTATGTEVFFPDGASIEERNLAKKLSETISTTLGIRNRGIKSESNSARKRLAMMRPKGRNVLIEVCFISNLNDMKLYDKHFEELVNNIAEVLIVKKIGEHQ